MTQRGHAGGETSMDGGWGWMVVFGSFLIHVIADGLAYSFGVYVESFLEYFETSRQAVGWLGSLMLGVTWGSGPIASAWTNRFGCRTMSVVGTLVAAFGFFISIFAVNIYFMFFSFGLIAGFGLGLLYLPAIVAVSFYFEKRRSLATGLAVCGSGIGTLIFAPLTDTLLVQYGWKGTVLIEIGLLLNCILCGAIFRPIVVKPPSTDHPVAVLPSSDVTEMKATYLVSCDSIATVNTGVSSAKQNMLVETLRPASRKDVYYSHSLLNIPMYREDRAEYDRSMLSLAKPEVKKESSSCSKFGQFIGCSRDTMDCSLMIDPVVVLFCISNLLTSIGFCVPYIFLPDRARQQGVATQQAAFLISVVGISNTVGRVIFGFLSDFKWVNRLMLYNTVLVLCGLATILSSFCVTYPLLVTYAALFGLFIGVYTCLTPIVLVDLLGLDKLSNSFGLVLMFQGIGALIGPPLAGLVYDVSLNYDYSFYMTGIAVTISGAMLYPIRCIRRQTTQHDIALGKLASTEQNIENDV